MLYVLFKNLSLLVNTHKAEREALAAFHTLTTRGQCFTASSWSLAQSVDVKLD